MCRIAGVVDRDCAQLEVAAARMRDAMAHGGPDSAGLFYDPSSHLAFGHRRLSIIDLHSSGDQPMYSSDRSISLVFNGEIYNYPSLKAELSQLGCSFNSQSDTEVILRGYETWGTAVFGRLRGMFAIAIHDQRSGQVILARDHAGIKPLYYSWKQGRLYFSSELRAFKELDQTWEENPDWKIYFLAFGFLPSGITTLKDVKPLEKGSFVVIDIRSNHFQQSFFYTDNFQESKIDEATARALVKEHLEKAVQRHLIADAPLGLFLSGGIDSSLLTLIAAQYKSDLNTLSIIFDDPAYSEKEYQEMIAKKIGSHHQAFTLTREHFMDSFEDIMQAMDQPSSDGVNSYFISGFAKQAGLKAVLSGLGADEFFGGYPSFARTETVGKLERIPGFLLKAAGWLPGDKYKKISYLSNPSHLSEYLMNRGYFTPLEIAKLLGVSVDEVNRVLYGIHLPPAMNNWSRGNRVSFMESNIYMEGQLLKDTDVMSMWHAIEVRVPFLDYDLIRMVQSLPSHLKFPPGQGKRLLIDSFTDILPREIWDRKKQGFVFPFQVWMKDHVNEFMPSSAHPELKKRYQEGKLSWSRYWTYLVAQNFKG